MKKTHKPRSEALCYLIKWGEGRALAVARPKTHTTTAVGNVITNHNNFTYRIMLAYLVRVVPKAQRKSSLSINIHECLESFLQIRHLGFSTQNI